MTVANDLWYGAASRERLLRRVHYAEAELQSEKQHAESLLRWGTKAYEELRRLEARCTFLYDTAVQHGVPKEYLRGDA